MKVENVDIYGIDQSIRGAKFPMSVNPDKLNICLTDGIKKLAQSPSGAGHDQWLTGCIVQFDLTFSNKAWVEAERYHFFDFVSSQSTMHRIEKFDFDSQCNEYVDERIKEDYKKLIEEYKLTKKLYGDAAEETKRKRLVLLYNIPSGFQLTARMTTNYRQLKTIYKQRKDHRLPEWREFCKWIETLPYSELITGDLNDT